MRRLVVNADDFGFTSGVNRAIVKAHTDGIVTSATLMANGPAFCEAKELRESREVELDVLTSPRAREILVRQGVELISYRDLVER